MINSLQVRHVTCGWIIFQGEQATSVLITKTRQAMYVWRNIQPRSRDYCCCGKAITVTYLVRVSVALVIRHAMHAIKLEHISFFHSLERYTYSHLTSLLHATMYQNLHSTHKYSDNGGKHHVVGVAWCRPNHDPITNAHPHSQSEEGKRARHNITCFESKIYYRHFAVTQVMRLDSGQVFSTWGMVTPWKNSSPNRNFFFTISNQNLQKPGT